MKLTITRLTIENFKGITKPIELNFDAHLTYIYGANHTGKTTTMDAVMWLLFGKNSQGEANFGIDPLDERGEIVHNLENSVTATFQKDNKNTITLRKVRKEVWKKQRGFDSSTYSHTTAYYIDGEKFSEKDYKQYISDQLIAEDIFKAITNPAYFPNLKADEQRKLLVAMVGEVSNEEATYGEESLKECLKEIGDTSMEDYNRHIGFMIKEVKAELEKLPGRISENQSALEAIKESCGDFGILREEIESLEEDIQVADKTITDLSQSVNNKYDVLKESRTQLTKLKEELETIRCEVENRNRKARQQHDVMLQDVKGKLQTAQAAANGKQNEVEEYKKQLNRLEIKKMDFRKQWQETEDMEYKWDGNENCPTCGQRLPEETIEASKLRGQANFNSRKQKAQDELDKMADEIKQWERKLNAQYMSATREAGQLEADVMALEQELDIAQRKEVPQEEYTELESYKGIEAKIRYKTTEIKAIEENSTCEDRDTARQEAESYRKQLLERRDTLLNKLANEESIKRHQKRIKELEQQEQALNQQLTQLERKEDDAKELTRRKTEMLQNKVNSLFAVVQFKMFNKLMNGNLEPTCECTMHGTPYQDLSNSEKITAGLDIINVMCKHNGATAPIFIDNAEAVNVMLPTIGQQIQLTVSTDKELKIII